MFRPQPSLFQAEQSHLSQPQFICQIEQFLNHLYGALLNQFCFAQCPPGIGAPALKMCLIRTEQRGRSTSLDLVAVVFLV